MSRPFSFRRTSTPQRPPRTPHPSWQQALTGESATGRRKPDAAEFWARIGALAL